MLAYPSIPPCRGNEVGIVQEKLDGYNLAIVVNEKEIYFMTRSQAYSIRTIPWNVKVNLDNIRLLYQLVGGKEIIIYGELIGLRRKYKTPHNYYVFDMVIVYDDGTEKLVPAMALKHIAEAAKLQVVPYLDEIPTEPFISKVDGVTPAEGYIIKDGTMIIGKGVLLKRAMCKHRFKGGEGGEISDMLSDASGTQAPLFLPER